MSTVQGQESLSLEAHHSLDMAGIFDLRWLARADGDPLMAVASYNGNVSLIAERGDSLEVGLSYVLAGDSCRK